MPRTMLRSPAIDIALYHYDLLSEENSHRFLIVTKYFVITRKRLTVSSLL